MPLPDSLPKPVDLPAPLASVENFPTVESSPLSVTETLTSVEPVVSALKTDSPKILPSQNALESPSSQLALESVVSTAKTDSSPVTGGGLTQSDFLRKTGMNAQSVNRWLKEGTFRQKTTQADGSYWEKRKKTSPGDNAVYFHVIPTPPDPSPD